jgi:hypothetical protein
MHISANVTSVLFFFVYSIIFCLTLFKNVTPSNPSYLIQQLTQQSSLVYIMVQCLSVIIINNLFFQKWQNVIVPGVISVVIYLMSVTMVYAQTSECENPKRFLAFTQSLKPFIAVIVSYFCVINFQWMTRGFYDITNNGETNFVGLWMALGFWMSSALLPTVTSVYFTVQKHTCDGDTQIIIKQLSDINKK